MAAVTSTASPTTPSKLRIAILGYRSEQLGYWDPDTTANGLPGSEEAAVYIDRELQKRGFRVAVYMNPAPTSSYNALTSTTAAANWYPVETWNDEDHTATYDLVLMWRRFDVTAGRKRGRLVLFWPHDSPPGVAAFPSFDGVCMLSEHHRRQFSGWTNFSNIPYTISGNGLVLEQFQRPSRYSNPYSIGYFSNYARGLVALMLLWPEIRRHFPQATLAVCYGRETWGTMPKEHYDFVIAKLEEYASIGVVEHGKVGHEQLADIMCRTSIWAYPCNYLGETETFCITAVKAQAAGCIPVITRVGALPETVHPEAPCAKKIENQDDIKEYGKLLLSVMQQVRSFDRKKFVEWGRKWTWGRCVDAWLELYHRLEAERSRSNELEAVAPRQDPVEGICLLTDA